MPAYPKTSNIRLPQTAQDQELLRLLIDQFRDVYAQLAALQNALSTAPGQNAPYIAPGYIELAEQTTAPAAPSANRVRIYAIDNGGKTELNARFPTGAVQQMEIEP